VAEYTIITSAVQERILNWYALNRCIAQQQVVADLVKNFIATEQDHFLDDQDDWLIQQLEGAVNASPTLPAEDKELLKAKLKRRRP